MISFYQLQMSRGDYNQVLMWTNGSLWGSSWRYILVSAPLILFLAGLVWTHSRTLDLSLIHISTSTHRENLQNRIDNFYNNRYPE